MSVTWYCPECDFDSDHKEFLKHLEQEHDVDISGKVKGTRELVLHINTGRKHPHPKTYRWTIEGKEYMQYIN